MNGDDSPHSRGLLVEPERSSPSAPQAEHAPVSQGPERRSGGPVRDADEIPVIVHASRTTRGQRVHEETQAVTTLPQGAVVRLKADLPLREPVVLTNRQNGLEVVCRVKSVKGARGALHDVDLEFAQPVQGFWEERKPGEEVRKGLDISPVEAAVPVVQGTLGLGAQSGFQSRGPQAEAAPGRRPIWQRAAPAQERKAPRLGAPTLRQSPQAIAYEETSGLSSATSAPRRERNDILAIVALASLVNGAVIGIWFYKQATNTNAAAAAVSPQPVVSQLEQPVQPAIPPAVRVPSGTAAPNPRGVTSESRTESRTQAREVVEPTPREPTADIEGDISGMQLPSVEKLQPPRIKNRLLVVQSAEPTAVVDANSAAGQLGPGIGLLGGAGAGPAAPPPSPMIGGHLEPPKLVRSIPPVYPSSARAMKVQGEVTLEALVDETGKVVETTPVSGHPLLLEAAKLAVQSWKYQPAHLDGKAIPMRVQVRLRFDSK